MKRMRQDKTAKLFQDWFTVASDLFYTTLGPIHILLHVQVWCLGSGAERKERSF